MSGDKAISLEEIRNGNVDLRCDSLILCVCFIFQYHQPCMLNDLLRCLCSSNYSFHGLLSGLQFDTFYAIIFFDVERHNVRSFSYSINPPESFAQCFSLFFTPS